MQCKNGGWASFDKDNDRMVFQYVPFADHNAMIDPECADITARILELLGYEGFGTNNRQIKDAVAYIRGQQAIKCRITDPGKGFQPDKIPHAAVCNPPGAPLQHHQLRESQGIRPEGFGILLARQMLDQVIYSENGNEVLLLKYLNTTPSS